MDAYVDEPEETLPEIDRLVRQMLTERGYQLDEPVTLEGEEREIVSRYVDARELVRRVEKGTHDPEDVETAFEGFADIHDFVVEERSPP